MNTKILASNIQHLRIEKNWTQNDIADFMNVSRQAVSKWETEKSIPDLELLLKLSKLFDKTINELLEVSEVKIINDIEDIIRIDKETISSVFSTFSEEEILKALKGISPELLNYICSIELFEDYRNKEKGLGPVKLSEVEIIHNELVSNFNKLYNVR